MGDELVTALLRESGLRVVLVTAGALAREARDLQEAQGDSAVLFGLGLAGGLLLGALQKPPSRVHLQLECDGPLRGLFVDANAEGRVRGYVKNPAVVWGEGSGGFRWRAALGNSGFLSVLRDLGGGDHYRSSVELTHFDLALDLETYFRSSEQLESVVSLETVARDGDALADVAGLLLQPLPHGDRGELAALGKSLLDGLALKSVLSAHPQANAVELVRALFPRSDLEVMSRFPAYYACECSKERVLGALLALGKSELEDMLAKEGHAEVKCEFCGRQYRVSGGEIRGLLQPS